MMRQGANSAVRFTTYVTLKQFVQGTARPGQPLPSAITFGIGGIAGLVTVYTTMPLECVFSPLHSCPVDMVFRPLILDFSVIKTRMQALDARAQYRNSFHCAYRIFTEEGIRRFWTGTTPRLTRLVVSRTRFTLTFFLGLYFPYLSFLLPCAFPTIDAGFLFLLAEWWYRVYGVREHHQNSWRTRSIGEKTQRERGYTGFILQLEHIYLP